MMLSNLNWSINHVSHIMSNESDRRHSQLNSLVLIMIIFCSFDDVFCKLSFIVVLIGIISISMRPLLRVVLIFSAITITIIIICIYAKHILPSSRFNCFIPAPKPQLVGFRSKKQLWNIYTLEII
jgi:hypothetical protein